MNVLIIEDEPFAQQELIRLLNEIDHDINVLKCIDSVEESVMFLNDRKATRFDLYGHTAFRWFKF